MTKTNFIKQTCIMLFLVTSVTYSAAQEYATIFGRAVNKQKQPVENVNVTIVGTTIGTSTGKNGNYELRVFAEKNITIGYTSVSYDVVLKKGSYSAGSRTEINVTLTESVHSLDAVTVDGESSTTNITRVNPKTIEYIPSASMDIVSSVLKTLGVATSSELSSQYRVRGGNFDENLVYVNDIEVYRPVLIRSGQQEGLSFVNGDMVSSIAFSAGGFDAKYGDKMSSVLDIKYQKPVKFGSTVSISVLGATAFVEGVSKNKKFTHKTGVRYKTSQYLLNTLETQGEYKPSYWDAQTFLTYKIAEFSELNLLGNYSRNNYDFVPTDRETSFGSYSDPMKLNVYFDGQEKDRFVSYSGALSYIYQPNDKLNLKFIVSAYHALEEEKFDIMGQYYLNDVDTDTDSETYGDSLMNLGIGTYIDHARNYLNSTILNAYHKAYYSFTNHELAWGAKYQHEIIDDNVREWEMIDSAGYSIPITDSAVSMYDFICSDNHIESNRITGYLQDTYTFDLEGIDLKMTLGVRANWWDYNNQLLISPRASVVLNPYWRRNIIFRFATGVYNQQAFYKETRNMDGTLNKDIKAQQSIHFIVGGEYNFIAWNRPFKVITELYYKNLTNLTPYEVDNVRIRYYANQKAKGYAAGLDFKINGHFVRGVDSWASISLLRTREDIEGDYYTRYIDENGDIVTSSGSTDDIVDTISVEAGYLPRPSDQALNIGLFFQDYLPNNDSYKMHLSLYYGSRLPVGPPTVGRQYATYHIPAYKRVDVGFSKIFKKESENKSGFLRHFGSLWISFEIYNVLDINNTVSYSWIKIVPNLGNTDTDSDVLSLYPVPNRLTGRRFNLKLSASF